LRWTLFIRKLNEASEEKTAVAGFLHCVRSLLAGQGAVKKDNSEPLLRRPCSSQSLRVNFIVSQFDEWYDLFGVVKTGDDLYIPPEERVRIF
jgi:hypothetical protein